jgi:hypothetical protein
MNQKQLERLEWLIARFSAYGLSPDIGSLTIVELEGLYRFLMRVANGG